jgi:hypothetical protein
MDPRVPIGACQAIGRARIDVEESLRFLELRRVPGAEAPLANTGRAWSETPLSMPSLAVQPCAEGTRVECVCPGGVACWNSAKETDDPPLRALTALRSEG